MSETVIAGKFRLGKKIGAGSFGEIYLGTNAQTGEMVAIKQESINTKHPQLIYESKVMRLLEGGLGVPDILWYGTEGPSNIMVLDLLGPSLEDLFNYCNHKLSLKTTLMIIDQMICRVEYTHHKCFIHRDIKPDNFLIGTGKRCTILYIIDFGLAKKYKDLKTSRHIPNSSGKSLTGTARYASVNAHKGNEQSRRDDLEAIGYVMLYFLNGSLPWQGINAKNREEKYRNIMAKKANTGVDELCMGLPEAIKTYFLYVKSLKFDDNPNYVYIRSLFKDLFTEQRFVYDYQFDWTLMGHPAAKAQAKILKNQRASAEIKEDIKEEREKGGNKDEIKEEDRLEEQKLVPIESSNLLLMQTPMRLGDELLNKSSPGANSPTGNSKKCIIF